MTEAKKTAGQIAYEKDVNDCPLYHNGTPRRNWDDLPEWAKESWEKSERPQIKRSGQ
jgi:hypothetical protein